MDKNSIIGLLIIALILVIYGIVNKPTEEEAHRLQRVRDSIQRVEQQREVTQQQQEQPGQIAKQKEPEQQTTDTGIKEPTAGDTSASQLKDIYGSFAVSAKGEQKFIVLENERLKVKISTRGGRPYSVELKEYQTYDDEPLILFSGDDNTFGFNFFANKRQIATNDLYFKPVNDIDSLYAGNTAQTVRLRLHAGSGRYIQYEYSLTPNTYMMDFNIDFVGMDQVIPNNYTEMNLTWDIKSPQQEKGADNEKNYTTVAYKYYQDEVDDLRARANDEAEEELNTRVKWVAFKQQFFSSILVANQYFTNSQVQFTSLDDSREYLKKLTADIGIPYESSSNYRVPMHFYFGPNHYNTLKQYDQEFENMIPLGWAIFKWVNQFIIIPIFNWLDNSIANYGIIILLLTLIIKLALFPLTYKS